VCAGVMVLCLAAQGILLYARDGATPDPLPWAFTLSDWVWLLLAASSLFYFKKPIVTVVAGWLAFLIFALLVERISHQDSLFWLWYDRLLMPLFIAASHIGFFLKRRSVQAPQLKS
jgi:hypothetical protein